MSGITLVWFSSRDKPFKAFYLKKWLVKFLLGTAVCLLLLSGAAGLISWKYYEQYAAYEQKYEQTAQELSDVQSEFAEKVEQQEKRLQEKSQVVREKDALLQDKELELFHVRQKLQNVRELEQKVRDYLGLEQKESEQKLDGFSHQGGFGLGLDNLGQSADSRLRSLNGISASRSHSEGLQADLQAILTHLQTERKKLDYIPSILPLKADEFWITQGYGWRRNPFTSQDEFHDALDIASAMKTPLVAPAKGTVSKVGNNHVWGNYLRIEHGQDMTTAYGHLHEVKVEEGQKVERREIIGLMGSTGRSTGPHVHYKVLKDGDSVDPKKYILDWDSEALTLRY